MQWLGEHTAWGHQQSTVVMYDIHRLGMCEGCMYTLLKAVHTRSCALCDTLPTHVILFRTRSHVWAWRPAADVTPLSERRCTAAAAAPTCPLTLPPHPPLRPRPAGTTRTAVRRAGRRGAATLPAPSRGGRHSAIIASPSHLFGETQAPGCKTSAVEVFGIGRLQPGRWTGVCTHTPPEYHSP